MARTGTTIARRMTRFAPEIFTVDKAQTGLIERLVMLRHVGSLTPETFRNAAQSRTTPATSPRGGSIDRKKPPAPDLRASRPCAGAIANAAEEPALHHLQF
jgi:hypothetical protein